MNRGTKTVAAFATLLLLGLASAQRTTPIILVLPSGETMPYSVDSRASATARVPTACYAAGSADCRMGYFTLSVDGAATDVPFDQIARADLVAPGTETVWRFTLRDGRVFDGVVEGLNARLYLNGLSDCCQNLILQSYPRRIERQGFISVIIDPSAPPPGPGATP